MQGEKMKKNNHMFAEPFSDIIKNKSSLVENNTIDHDHYFNLKPLGKEGKIAKMNRRNINSSIDLDVEYDVKGK